MGLFDESSVDEPVLESHDPYSGMGVYRLPDQSTMDVHLPSAGITPGPEVPVISAPRSRVPVSTTPPLLQRPSVDVGVPPALAREDLSDITSSRPLPAPRVPPSLARPVIPTIGPPESIATSPQQQRANELRRRAAREQAAYEAQVAAQRLQSEQTGLEHELTESEHQTTADELARQQRMARDTSEMEHSLAESEHASIPAEQRARYVHGVDSAPDRFGIITRSYDPAGVRTERIGPPQAFQREREFLQRQQELANLSRDRLAAAHPYMDSDMSARTEPVGGRRPSLDFDVSQATHEGTTTFPDGSISRTDAQGRSVFPSAGTLTNPDGSSIITLEDGTQIHLDAQGNPVGMQDYQEGAIPEGVPASWLNPSVAGLREAARSGRATSEALSYPEGRPLPQQIPIPGSISPQEPSSVPEGEGITTGPVTPSRPRGGSGMRHPVAPSIPPTISAGGSRYSSQSDIERQLGLSPQAAPQIPGTSARLPQGNPNFEELAGQAPQRAPDLVDRQYNVASKEAEIQANGIRAQQQAEQEAERQRQQLEQERQNAVGRATRAYQNAIDEVHNSRINPNQFWQDRGASGLVTAAIAVSLGALGNAVQGNNGPNLALEQINHAVEQDIQAQQDNLSNLRDAAGMQGNMVGIMRQEFSDRGAAQEAARAAMLQQAALQVQEQQANLGDAQAQNAATQLRQQIEAEAEAARQAAIEAQSQQDLRTAQTQRQLGLAEESMAQAGLLDQRRQRLEWMRTHPGAGRAPNPATSAQWEAFNHAIESGMNSTEAAHVSFPPDSPLYYNPPQHAAIGGTERAALEDISAALERVHRDVPQEVQEDIPGYGMTGLFPRLLLSQEGRDIRADIANLRDAFGRDRTGANMPAYEVATFDEILGSSGTSTDEDLRHGLDRMRDIIAAHLNRGADTLNPTERDVRDIAPSAREIRE